VNQARQREKMLDTPRVTGDLQALDAAHHLHSFTDPQLIASGKTHDLLCQSSGPVAGAKRERPGALGSPARNGNSRPSLNARLATRTDPEGRRIGNHAR
jgi:hypothetical protein